MTIINCAISINDMLFRSPLCLCIQGYAYTCGEVDHTHKENSYFFSRENDCFLSFILLITSRVLLNPHHGVKQYFHTMDVVSSHWYT